MNKQRFIIILAGGIGVRFGSSLGKQYTEIGGRPIIVWTIEKYLRLFSIEHIIVVINESHLLLWKGLTNDYEHLRPIQTVVGGEQRFHSVKNALNHISCAGDDLIGVHDGVRPFVSTATIKNAYATADVHGSGVPVFDSVNTLRIKQGSKNNAIDRATIKEVQNPQVFKSAILKKAYQQPYEPLFLDDATIVEADGNNIHLSRGNYENIKITHPQDIYIAEGLLPLYHTDLNVDGGLDKNERHKAL
ncbi:2-C-methyl-D-erythritol 4-phosphate cytidylyltransferase [Sphingobacterium phlebotomi]|uniref:2-C-methyl-D-erythritol 4-phosphate cytidylyltransferase n=1 Tax=Sphingobacterium phlebotomi TaxID=2605433 RepID=A0A5D4GQZ4_9SPHI|nr:2-C-methyl-D-erythritol 4-phosphate cytidylyltransferase [Sphingobacterium phlebotomi]TYR31241.1 2-C-methyl-D-erythritol 4-phosphate cytidylyltransferase [Sphingobacterium phlebotomi]